MELSSSTFSEEAGKSGLLRGNNHSDREGAKMGDHETPEREKTEKMTSSNPQFSNFWFKAFRILDHTLSLASLKGPWSLVINYFLLKLIRSRFLLLVTKRQLAKVGSFSSLSLLHRLGDRGVKQSFIE